MKKYLVCPGIVVSENDGEKHYIGARRLMELYKVKQEDCIIVDSPESARGIKWEEHIQLRPDRTGKYQIS